MVGFAERRAAIFGEELGAAPFEMAIAGSAGIMASAGTYERSVGLPR